VCKLQQVFVFLIPGQLKFYKHFVTEIDIFLFAFKFLKFESRELFISELYQNISQKASILFRALIMYARKHYTEALV
jgi:hypothetical protein